MKLNVKAFTLTASLFWGGLVCIAALANLAWPPYSQVFLDWLASFYPGYHAGLSLGQVLIATVYALADGAIGGFLFAWLYNHLAGKFSGGAS